VNNKELGMYHEVRRHNRSDAVGDGKVKEDERGHFRGVFLHMSITDKLTNGEEEETGNSEVPDDFDMARHVLWLIEENENVDEDQKRGSNNRYHSEGTSTMPRSGKLFTVRVAIALEQVVVSLGTLI